MSIAAQLDSSIDRIQDENQGSLVVGVAGVQLGAILDRHELLLVHTLLALLFSILLYLLYALQSDDLGP
jgi:hypothetical protein